MGTSETSHTYEKRSSPNVRLFFSTVGDKFIGTGVFSKLPRKGWHLELFVTREFTGRVYEVEMLWLMVQRYPGKDFWIDVGMDNKYLVNCAAEIGFLIQDRNQETRIFTMVRRA